MRCNSHHHHHHLADADAIDIDCQPHTEYSALLQPNSWRQRWPFTFCIKKKNATSWTHQTVDHFGEYFRRVSVPFRRRTARTRMKHMQTTLRTCSRCDGPLRRNIRGPFSRSPPKAYSGLQRLSHGRFSKQAHWNHWRQQTVFERSSTCPIF